MTQYDILYDSYGNQYNLIAKEDSYSKWYVYLPDVNKQVAETLVEALRKAEE